MSLNAFESQFPHMGKVGGMVLASGSQVPVGRNHTPDTYKRGHFIWRIDYLGSGRLSSQIGGKWQILAALGSHYHPLSQMSEQVEVLAQKPGLVRAGPIEKTQLLQDHYCVRARKEKFPCFFPLPAHQPFTTASYWLNPMKAQESKKHGTEQSRKRAETGSESGKQTGRLRTSQSCCGFKRKACKVRNTAPGMEACLMEVISAISCNNIYYRLEFDMDDMDLASSSSVSSPFL